MNKQAIDSENIVTDWDEIFSLQINIDSFTGFCQRKGKEIAQLRDDLAPFFEEVKFPSLRVEELEQQ